MYRGYSECTGGSIVSVQVGSSECTGGFSECTGGF